MGVWGDIMKLFQWVLLSICLLPLSGCAFLMDDKIHYSWSGDAGETSTSGVPSARGGTVLGIALSGGGSRASLFGAAALEVMAEEGLLDRADYLSSVSGGGFPAAYYALNKPEACLARTSQDACDENSFARFKQAMRQDFLSSMTVRQLSRPNRISSPTRRLNSLQDVIDEAFAGKATFGDLPASPVLLINGARYDDARRFVFSNAPIAEDQDGYAHFANPTLRTASFSQPGCPRAVPSDFSVALAVAISAGFPPLLGPAAIEMPASCNSADTQYWHLGDGGILDNTGIETIEDYALHSDAETRGRAKQIIILSVDSGRSTSAEEMMETRNLKLWTTDPGRVVEIVNKRAIAYREYALAQLEDASGASFHIVKMHYLDAQLDAWPASCGNRNGGRDAIRDELARVPTNFRITDCHADLMERAADDVVRRAIRENSEVLRRARAPGQAQAGD